MQDVHDPDGSAWRLRSKETAVAFDPLGCLRHILDLQLVAVGLRRQQALLFNSVDHSALPATLQILQIMACANVLLVLLTQHDYRKVVKSD